MRPRLRTLRAKFLLVIVPLVLSAIVVVFGLFEYSANQRASANRSPSARPTSFSALLGR